MMLFQGEQAFEPIPMALQDEGGEQAGCPPIAVIVRMNGNELFMHQGCQKWHGDPPDQLFPGISKIIPVRENTAPEPGGGGDLPVGRSGYR